MPNLRRLPSGSLNEHAPHAGPRQPSRLLRGASAFEVLDAFALFKSCLGSRTIIPQRDYFFRTVSQTSSPGFNSFYIFQSERIRINITF